MFEENRFQKKDRTTEEDHAYLRENYREYGYPSPAAFLEYIINYFKSHEDNQ